MSFISKNCQKCGISFQADVKYHNQGQAKFCSKQCSYDAKIKIKVYKDKLCPQCSTSFKANSKFCSQKCANTFTSKQNRELKNKNISKALAVYNKENGRISITDVSIDLECVHCKIIFTARQDQRRRKTCSEKCEMDLRRTPEMRNVFSLAAIKRIGSDTNTDRLKSIHCNYFFYNKIIRCDSKAEYSCLNYIETNYDVADIERCTLILEYELEGNIRRYNPDFEITLKNGKKLIVECKTPLSNKDLKRKWKIYYSSIEPKKKVLEKYCLENECDILFYNKDMNSKFYNSISKDQLQSAISPEVKTQL